MKLNNAEYWRSRAEEARAVAVQMMDPHEAAQPRRGQADRGERGEVVPG